MDGSAETPPNGRSGPGAETGFPWYVLRVRANAERTASHALSEGGYSVFAPFYRTRRRWSDRTKTIECPLFPGYVFCRFHSERRVPVLQTPGVVDILRFGPRYAPVDEAEIAAIRQAVTSGAEVVPWPYLRVGQRVRVCGGALHGATGLLLKLKNGRRLVLSITLLQRSVAVELDREAVEPLL